MFTSKLMDSAQRSASSARDYAIGRANGQVGEFAAKLRTTSGIAPLVEQAEGAFAKAASYLEGRGVDKIVLDVEALSRKRPVAATFVASLVGFAVSRAVKASSVKRYDATDLESK
jgi:hypothetical protein